MKMNKRGYFITLEGSEGSGKSTQARWLIQTLRRRGHKVVFVRDPGSTALGRALRRVLLHSTAPLSAMEEALLFIGGRVQLVEEKIVPALKAGKVVICDRFHDSTIVYQGYAGGLDVTWLDQLGRKAIQGVMPDLTIVLDIPVKQGFARLRRSHDRMESKARIFHQRVRAGFRKFARLNRRRMVVIDAGKPARVVHGQIEKAVLGRLHRN